MKPGDTWDCPHCGKSAFLKMESRYDGWTKLGDVLSCSACGVEIQPLSSVASDIPPKKSSSPPDASALLSLLGGDERESVSVNFDDAPRRFCKDCRFRVMNAFRIRCARHEKDVQPMDDCEEFEPRTATPSEKGTPLG